MAKSNQSSNNNAPIRKSFKRKLSTTIPQSITFAWVICMIVSCYTWSSNGFNSALINAQEKVLVQRIFLLGNAHFIWSWGYLKGMDSWRDVKNHVEQTQSYQTAVDQLHKTDWSDNFLSRSVLSSFPFLSTWWRYIKAFFILAWQNLLYVLLKLAESIFFIPVIILSMIAGFFDGWIVGRNIRKAEHDSESAFRFHKFILFLPLVLSGVLTLHLVLPFEVAPALLCLVLMFIAFYYSGFAAQRFKQKL
ncbi:DUF4400 domain-containing protein [Cysteiniphilum halobium]|uniref:DUF4400 domain-containing protein n=1 Tax=Cysteiniphilum halobium TaxID=2219059 RepID=UPI000E655FF9|nr:DUF4400 domain-containing protein [Cysteiniphilum halobium]